MSKSAAKNKKKREAKARAKQEQEVTGEAQCDFFAVLREQCIHESISNS